MLFGMTDGYRSYSQIRYLRSKAFVKHVLANFAPRVLGRCIPQTKGRLQKELTEVDYPT
jgi:hypothetical protein